MNHAEEPYTTIGVAASIYYFAHYLILLPISGIVSNTLEDMGTVTRLSVFIRSPYSP